MAHLVEAYGNSARGFPRINLDHVASLEPVKDGNGKVEAYDAVDANGDRIGKISRHEIHDPPATIPDHTGSMLLVAEYNEETDSPEFRRYPIVAWHVCAGEPIEPVICESLPDVWSIELRDKGQAYAWVAPYECYFTDYQRFCDSLLPDLRAEHEQLHKSLTANDSPSSNGVTPP
jgi:hypothetical protein